MKLNRIISTALIFVMLFASIVAAIPVTGFASEEAEYVVNVLENDTKDGALTLNVALNYGARDEIVHAVNKLIAEGKDTVTAEDISAALYTAKSPDPDLVVRTGGEYRISNFLLWQSAYAEYCFTSTLWPDLSKDEIDGIVLDFLRRDRRFGGVKNAD